MAEKTPTEFLTDLYNDAMSIVGSKEDITSNLKPREQELLNVVLQYSEQAKAVLTVLVTSLVIKLLILLKTFVTIKQALKVAILGELLTQSSSLLL